MLERLSAGEATVTDLAQPFAMSLPAVMQHLSVLEEAGLIMSEKVGRVRTIRLQPQALEAVSAWLAARRQEWNTRFDRLEAYLDTMKEGNADGNT